MYRSPKKLGSWTISLGKGEDYAKERGVVCSGWRCCRGSFSDGGGAVLAARGTNCLYRFGSGRLEGQFQCAVVSRRTRGRVQVLGDGVDAAMFTRRHAAVVSVNGEDRKASMGILGGENVAVTVSGGGIPPLPRMHTDEHGRRVVVYAKDDKPEAKMSIGKHGGYVHVSGGNEDYRSKAMMYIAPYGGAISTRDKNGNRLADLE